MHSSGDGAHRVTAVAVVVVAPIGVARVEAEAVGVVRARRDLRGRPVVAEGTNVVEVAAAAKARRRQEDGAAIGTCELPAANSVQGCPGIGAITAQFILLLF